MTFVSVVAAAVIGYVLGSVPTGVLVARRRGVDVRDQGSGKTGFTNALRSLGLAPAALVVTVDVAKGAAAVLIGSAVFDDPWAAAFGGVAAVAGHNWPLFARFRGGRGVATTFGAFLAMAPLAAVLVLLAGFVVLAVTRYVSLMSVTGVFAGFLVLVVLAAAERVPEGLQLPHEYVFFGALVTLFVEISHLGNIRRLLAGTEPKIGQGGPSRGGSGA